jgi:hypothetical protein
MSEIRTTEPFGRRAVADLSSPDLLLALERREQKSEFFRQVDCLAALTIGRALKREIVITVEGRLRKANIAIAGLLAHEQELLMNIYSVEQQQLRGAWFLPEKATLKAGLANLSAMFLQYPRFAHRISAEQSGMVVFAENPAALFVWSILEPFFCRLFLPLEIRAEWSGIKTREELLSAWAEIDQFVAALGLQLEHEFAVMRYGGGWGRLASNDQLKAKQKLLASIAEQTTESTIKRFRAFCCLDFLAHYYSKAENGRATRRRALDRISDKKTLVGFFQGDWLSFLEYLGEQPHPDEQVTTAIAEPKFFVGGEKTPAAVAREKGVPLEEVERVLSTFWDVPSRKVRRLASPVEERVAVLSDFWFAFHEIHSHQAPGAKALWGLIEESRSIRLGWQGPDWYNSGLYQQLLPQPVLGPIEEFWGALMLPRWPNRIVSEISPHALMAETFGPALAFWHGCALTAWFICEGPYSRTDIQGLRGYYQRELAALEQFGTPIDPSLFTEMSKAEARLGPAVPLERSVSPPDSQPGIPFSLRVVTGERRSGFEILRDIITHHRRAWASSYLSSYLRARWERDLREPTRVHAQTIADKGKSPPPKQFARQAAVATNRWFGGDISAFCAAIGEKSVFRPTRVSLMPADRRGFAAKVLISLQNNCSELDGRKQSPTQRNFDLERLAEESLRVAQLREALGRPPTLKEFGRFDHLGPALNPDVQKAWHTYISLINAELCHGLT